MSQLANIAGLTTINISYATVHLGAVAGVSLGATYNIGDGGSLDFRNVTSVGASTSINFTGANGKFAISTTYTPTLLTSFSGFGPGKTIDIASATATRVSYADNAGSNTGGTLTIYGANDAVLNTLPFANGDFVSNNFSLTPDSGTGTLLQFQSYVTGVTTMPGSALLGLGKTVSLFVSFSNPITIDTGLGAPSLTLNNGGTAVYDAVHSTSTQLAFVYTVGAGQDTNDLTVTGLTSNGAALTARGGGSVSLTGVVTNPSGILIIDTIAPTVASVSVDQPNAVLGSGGTIAITVTLTEPVTIVSGTPTLSLNDGGTATYNSQASTATSLVFTHTVQPGNNAADLGIDRINATGVITDLAGNPANLAGAVGNLAGVLVIDTLAPTVGTVSVDHPNAILGANGTVVFSLGLSEPITLGGSGTPTLSLSDGGLATYDPSSSTHTTLNFRYVVQPGENATDLSVLGVNLNGASASDAAGNVLNLAGALGNPAGTLVVDTTAPTVTSVTLDHPNGDITIGQTVTFSVALSEPVTIAGGVPALILNDGGTALYDASSSTATTLSFRYTVQPGDDTPDLSVTALDLRGATMLDQAANPIDARSLIVNPPGTLQVDTNAPVVTSVTMSPGSGQVGAGQTVTITLSLSEAIAAGGGTPTLTLSDGGIATLDAAHSTPTALVFTHVVQAGQNTPDLAITATTIAGNPLADAAGNLVDFTAARVNPSGVLIVATSAVTNPTNPSLTPPQVLSTTTTPGSGTVTPGQVVSILVKTDNPVFLAGGTPVLALSDGGFATYDAANSTPTNLVFTTTIQPGQLTDNLAVVGFDLHGASIADVAGTPLDLSAAEVDPPGILAVVNAVPVNTSPTGTNPVSTSPIGTVPVDSSSGSTSPTGTSATGTSSTGTNPPDVASGISNPDSTGASTPASQSSDSSTTNPAVPGVVSVYRFFDSRTGTHFYTSSTDERNSILASRPDLVPEGQDGVGLRAVNPASGDPASAEVFRFFDTVHGTQFLTADKNERDDIISNRPDLTFEPEGSFFEHVQPQPSDTPVYRFFSSTDGTHFYTDSASERASILQTRPDLIAEGVGFYEPS